jgi:single-stranded-DNA-specific exonuclease
MEYQLIAERDKKLSAIEQVLTNRGITDIDHYLNTSDKDILDLSTIDHLKEGATMLALHIAKGSKVMIQIDSDCDGYTSAALLINYLNKLFPAFV